MRTRLFTEFETPARPTHLAIFRLLVEMKRDVSVGLIGAVETMLARCVAAMMKNAVEEAEI